MNRQNLVFNRVAKMWEEL